MLYKITYTKREVVNAYSKNAKAVNVGENIVEINAKSVDDARRLFYEDPSSAHCFIKLIERTTPKPKKSRGKKKNSKDVEKALAKKQAKKEKDRIWKEKHPDGRRRNKKNVQEN